jgi:Mg/Co/Ni transporter MgtE
MKVVLSTEGTREMWDELPAEDRNQAFENMDRDDRLQMIMVLSDDQVVKVFKNRKYEFVDNLYCDIARSVNNMLVTMTMSKRQMPEFIRLLNLMAKDPALWRRLKEDYPNVPEKMREKYPDVLEGIEAER